MSRWNGQRPNSEAIRGGAAWDLPGGGQPQPEPPLSAREVQLLKVECPKCKYPFEVAAAPFSPVWAKVICPRVSCEHQFEARTRDGAMEAISEECDYQEDVRNQRAHPKAFSKWARTRPATSSRKEIATPLGRALVIEP